MKKGFRFIHAADLHLDSPFVGLSELPAGVREEIRRSTYAALDQLVALAIEAEADFVVIAGDVYDAADRSLRAQIRFQKAMEQLAERGISAFVVHGNHDPADGREARLSWPAGVHIFHPGGVERVPVVLKDRGHVADIYGISYPTAAVKDNYVRLFRPEGESPYRIGLLHANVEGNRDHANYAPCTLQELREAGLDYWALGHVHGTKVLSERPWVVYPGNTQGRSIRETGPKGCFVVDVTEEGETSLSFHALDAVRWMQRRLSIEGLTGEQELKETLEGLLDAARREAEGRPGVLRVELEGRGALHRLLRHGSAIGELAAELRSREAERFDKDFIWLESVKVRTGALLDYESLRESPGFLGDLLRMSDELALDEEKLLAFAEAALVPLLEHPKAGPLLLMGEKAAGGSGGLQAQEAADWLKAAAEWAADSLLDGEGEEG